MRVTQESDVMKISVVICTCNRPERLKGAINSCLSQSVLPKEIIIVDDSQESIEQHIGKYIQRARECGIEIRYIRKDRKNRGLTKSRNIGWRIAQGEIIQFLDDDAELPKQGLEFVCDVFEKDEKNELVAVDFPIDEQAMEKAGRRLIEFCYRLAGLWKAGIRFNRNNGLPEGLKNLPYLEKLRFLQGGSMAIRKYALEHIGGFDENLGISCVGEDKDVSIRLSQIGFLGRIITMSVKHYSDSAGRVDGFKYGCETGFNYLYINCKVGQLGVGERLLIGYNVVILILTEILFACIGSRAFHISQIKGILFGVYRFFVYRFILKLCRHRNRQNQ